MITNNYMPRLLLAVVCTAFISVTALAADPSMPLNEDEVSLQKIKTFFDAAFLKATFDEDGDLRIEDGGFKVFVKVDREKKLIIFISAFNLKASVPAIKKLQFVNTLNADLIFARFSMRGPTTLLCDYQLLYEGGITPYTVVNNYRLYAKVINGAVCTQDPEDIIGSD